MFREWITKAKEWIKANHKLMFIVFGAFIVGIVVCGILIK
jgi:hypothetical protein